ncbi:MAG: T9SS type A sorting domain-containing protein, partial [Balneolaceae bacterium]|nr:T9SS type A sorting domain-containing protein [Balneolaceae bacterium]
EVFPLAIQGIELSAETAASVITEKGSLILTEIYSGTGGSEYIELYNPTGSALPLSGLTVRSGDRSIVVQHDVVVPPYSYFVLAESRFAPSIESVPGYVYYGELLNGSSGFVELLHGDNEVARAAFDISDSRSSLELDRTINGFDGYSSLQNFLPSNTDLGSGISGSPGTSGNSRRHFIRSLNGQSPKLMSFPGFLPSSQNRSLVGVLEIRNLRGEAVNPNDALPGEPYLLRYNGESSLRLYAEEIASAFGSDRPIKVSADDSPFSYLTLPASAGLTLSGLLNEFNQPIVPAAQVWNEETRRFDVIYSDAATLNSWDPLIVNSDIPRPQKAVAETETRIEPQRMITFSVFEEQGGNRESLIDQAYLSFMPDYWTSTGRRYDLPKLMPLPASDTDPLVEDRETSLFYIRNAESNLSVNSFTHLPYEPMSDYRLTADLLSTKGSMQTVLSWSLTDDIPDEWNIVLEDQLTGQRIDMREQTSYRYRHAASAPLEIDNAEEETEPIRMIDTGLPSEDRFTILISPYESPLGLQEDAEQPGSVELRQNYPNPFNPTTNIVYFLPDDRQIRIGVYNVVGQQVATLVDEAMSAGEHTATWNASDMPSGIYIVQLESGNQVFTRKITLIK